MLFGYFQIINIYVAKCLEKRRRKIIESKLNDTQRGFRPGHSTTAQIFTLQQIFEKSWEYAKNVYTFCRLRESMRLGSSSKALWRLAGVQC